MSEVLNRIAACIYALNPCSDQNVDADLRPIGPAFELTWDQFCEAWPESAACILECAGKIINAPETFDFMSGVPLEAAHQRDRWGVEHDAGKTPFDWFWLIGYLSQKAASAAVAGDIEKAKHHTVSTAAALANWHAALSGTSNLMRPGIDPATQGFAA